MKKLRIRSASEQLADYLKDEILRKTWTDVMPGESWLVKHLQIGRDTVRAAMGNLEAQGLLVPQGHGRRRKIVISEAQNASRSLRVKILLYGKINSEDIDNAILLAQLQEAGFAAEFAAKSLQDLGMRVDRVAKFVEQNPADAWIISAGSKEINAWFSQQTIPALAMYGRFGGFPIAAAYPEMMSSMVASVRRLIELGHNRIVMFSREERRKPEMAQAEKTFIYELESAGISTGEFNLPDWEETREGLNRRLDELFRVSPPTAIIFQESPIFIAARSHLADLGIVAPRDISLVTSNPDPSFEWCQPEVSHIKWDYSHVVRRIVRWVENVAKGKDDRSQIGSKSEFIEGGTIGPVPRS